MVEYVVINGPSAQQSDIENFVRLIRAGGAVNEEYVRRGIMRAGAKLVMACCDNHIIGVAALKIPADNYRNTIASSAKSGHPLPADQFPFELGYVAVSQGYEGQGIAKTMIKRIIQLSNGDRLFATTSNPAMMSKLLPRAGFECAGASWLNDEKERLYLYTLNR